MKRLNTNRLLQILDIIRFVLVLFLIAMFVNFNAKIANQTAQTQIAANNTSTLVKSQARILDAIKAVTDDTHTTAAQQTAIIICMLQVPVDQRTTDLQQQCRSQVSAVSADNGAGTGQNSSDKTFQTPSSQPTPSNGSGQSDTSQTPSPNPKPLNCKVDVLFLHIGC
jgi:hypothetical protein